jgi:hypothetical protein
MAKLKVKQIEDLGIIEDSGENAVTYNAIKIGANTIAPLTTIIEDTAHSGYISGLTQSGNKIVITRTALPTIPDVSIPEVAGSFVLNAAVNATNKHQIDLTRGTFDVSTTGESAHTGSLIFDANKLSVNDAWVKGLFSVTPESETGKYISGLTYANGVFTPTYKALTAAEVAVATGIEGLEATNVQGALAELAGDIAALDAAQLSAGKGISITDKKINANFTVDTKKYPTESTAEGYVADKAGKTYIRIMDGETLISETDAAAFVKDGFLASVTKDEATNELIFTWNTDAEAGEANQVTKIAIKELCDVYTVGEGLVASEGGYKFSHQAGTTGLTADTAFGSGSATAKKITVKVPSVTVDKFGHVSALTETEVSLEIPASIDTAVQNVTGDTYVGATKNGTEVTLATKTQAVETATDTANGLATALDVKSYVDSKVAGATVEASETLEFSKVVKGTITGHGDVTLTLGEGYKIEADSVCVYVNGQLIPAGGYEIDVDSNKVKILKPQYGEAGGAFELDDNDRIDVVAHATKTVTLTYLKLQTAQTPQA